MCYSEVLELDFGILDFAPAQKPRKLPVVMTFRETLDTLLQFSGVYRLQSESMYGCGLRISESLRLRIKDLEAHTIQINDAKGEKNRLLMMPRRLQSSLQEHLKTIRVYYDRDREKDVPGVWMPTALEIFV